MNVTFSECLRRDFKRHYAETGFPNCTTPWTQNLLGQVDYNDTKPCSNEESDIEQRMITAYFYKTINQKNQNCPRKLMI